MIIHLFQTIHSRCFILTLTSTPGKNASHPTFPRIHNLRTSPLSPRSHPINSDPDTKWPPRLMIHPKQPTFRTIILPSLSEHPLTRPARPTIPTLLSLSHNPHLPIPLHPLCKRNQRSYCIVMFPVIRTGITQDNPMILFPSPSVFPSRTDLTCMVAYDRFMIWIDRTRRMVFCPVQAAGIAVISATFVGAPVRGFSSVAVLTELGARKEWI
jgi:hypothetical protein